MEHCLHCGETYEGAFCSEECARAWEKEMEEDVKC